MATQNLFSPPSSTFFFSKDIDNYPAIYAYWIPAIDHYAYSKQKNSSRPQINIERSSSTAIIDAKIAKRVSLQTGLEPATFR